LSNLPRRTGFVPISNFFFQVGKYLLDDHRVLNAGDHFGGTAAFPACFDINIDKSAGELICTAIGCPIGGGGTGGMYRMNTRFNRWARVIDAWCSAGVCSGGSLA
jgi:hypothetical protein